MPLPFPLATEREKRGDKMTQMGTTEIGKYDSDARKMHSNEKEMTRHQLKANFTFPSLKDPFRIKGTGQPGVLVSSPDYIIEAILRSLGR